MPTLTLEARLNRLFTFGHARDQPEISTEDLARAVSQRLGRAVDLVVIAEARAGQRAELPIDISSAICTEFGVKPIYLADADDPEIEQIHLLMRLWSLARDLGLHLAARGHELDIPTLREVIEWLERAARVRSALTRDSRPAEAC